MDWPVPTPAIGRLANFGALRKTRVKDHGIFETSFGNYILIHLISYLLTPLILLNTTIHSSSLLSSSQFDSSNFFPIPNTQSLPICIFLAIQTHLDIFSTSSRPAPF